MHGGRPLQGPKILLLLPQLVLGDAHAARARAHRGIRHPGTVALAEKTLDVVPLGQANTHMMKKEKRRKKKRKREKKEKGEMRG